MTKTGQTDLLLSDAANTISWPSRPGTGISDDQIRRGRAGGHGKAEFGTSAIVRIAAEGGSGHQTSLTQAVVIRTMANNERD